MNQADALRRELAPTLERLVRRCSEAALRHTVRNATNNFIEALVEAYPAESGAPLRPHVTRCLSRFVSTLIEALTEEPETRFAPAHRSCSDTQRQELRGATDQDTAHGVESASRCHWLPEALACLDSETKQLFLWYYYEDRSLAEIVLWMGTSEASIRARLQNAMAALRQELPTAGQQSEV